MSQHLADIRKAAVNGLELAYQCFGEPEHPTLLLVMGLGAQLQTWPSGFCQLLADSGYYVIRFDNRDCGQSSSFAQAGLPDLAAIMQGRPPALPPAYRLEDMADDAFALLDHLGIDQCHLAGASMGGMIVQLMALRQPQRLLSLMPIMSSSGDPTLPPPTPAAQAILLTPAPEPLAENTFVPFMIEGWRVLCGAALPFEEVRIRALVISTFRRGYNPTGVARQFAAILLDGDRTARLAGIKTPTLVIHGTQDPLLRPEAGRAIASAIPNAGFLAIEGMGHDIPQACWSQITSGMQQLMRSAPPFRDRTL
jgi:pimeloyl-ACP methyl ester carboxylesterase